MILWLVCLFCVFESTCTNFTTVTLQLKWLLQGQFGGYVAAQELGFYEEQCLIVSIRPGGPSIIVEDEVIAGRAQIGVTWLSTALVAKDTGYNITLLSQIFRRASLVQIAWNDAGITSIPDMRGKKVCVWGGGNEDSLRVAFNKYNLTWDYNWLAGFTNGSADVILQPFSMTMFLDRSCDTAAATRYNELAQVLQSVDPRDSSSSRLITLNDISVIDFNAMNVSSLEDCLIVDAEWLEENEDVAIRFLAATFKGWMYMRDNPMDVFQLFVDKTPGETWMIHEINKLIWPFPLGIGIVEPALMQRTADILYEFGLIHTPINNVSTDFAHLDLVYAAHARMLNPIFPKASGTWSPTDYGPGSTDYWGLDYQGVNVSFCMGDTDVVICPPVLFSSSSSYLSWGGSGAITLLILFILSLILLLCTAAGLLKFRKHPVIKASTVTLSVTMTVGGIIAICVVPFLLGYPTTANCHIRFWLLGIGYELFFGAFVLKTYRIHRIFNNPLLQKIEFLTDAYLFKRLLLLVSGMTGLLIIFSLIARPSVVVVRQNLTTTGTECQLEAGTASTAILTVLLGYVSILGLAGLFFAFKIRAVRTAYNESKFLGFSIYNTALAALLVGPTFNTTNTMAAALIILGIGVMFAVVGSLSCLFIPKFWIISHYEKYKLSHNEVQMDSNGSGTHVASFMAGVNEELLSVGSIQTLQNYRTALRKCLEAIDREIQRRQQGGPPRPTGVVGSPNATGEIEFSQVRDDLSVLDAGGGASGREAGGGIPSSTSSRTRGIGGIGGSGASPQCSPTKPDPEQQAESYFSAQSPPAPAGDFFVV